MTTGWGPFSKPPNILIIMTDQQRSVQHFPPGWQEANLPWLTHLQETGVTFPRGMVSTTACSPSRSTIFSSTYPVINGVKRVGDTLLKVNQSLPTGGKLTTLGQVMERAGYHVEYKGKWHLDRDFDQMSRLRPMHQDIMMIEDDAMEANWSFPNWTSPDFGTAEAVTGTSSTTPATYSRLNTLGGGWVNNDARVVNGPLYSPKQETPVDVLKNWDPDSDEPFCMVVSMCNPHDVWLYPYSYKLAGYLEPVWNGPDYRDFELPKSYFQTDLSTKPQTQQFWQAFFQGGPLPDADALTYARFYAYLYTLTDRLTGDLIKAMRHNKYDGEKLERDTLVVRLSDHGEMGMAQGGMRQKENNCYNETILVPMIFSNPLLHHQGKSSESLVGLIDILPTLADIGGIDDPSSGGQYTIQGHSFAETILHPFEPPRERHLFATEDCTDTSDGITSIRAIIEKDWKYAVYYAADYNSPNPNGIASNFQYEMYDYTTDDGWSEIDNLLYSPTPATNLQWQILHRSLTELMIESNTKPDGWPTSLG